MQSHERTSSSSPGGSNGGELGKPSDHSRGGIIERKGVSKLLVPFDMLTGNHVWDPESMIQKPEVSPAGERQIIYPNLDLHLVTNSSQEIERLQPDLQTLVDFIQHDRSHFSKPPLTIKDLERKAIKRKDRNLFLFYQDGQFVGSGGVNDADENEHDHFIVGVIVGDEFRGKGYGKAIIVSLLDWMTVHHTADQRRREKAVMAVVDTSNRLPDLTRGVDRVRWEDIPREMKEPMMNIADELGFEYVGTNKKQVNVDIPTTDGKGWVNDTRPTIRFEYDLDDWRKLRVR